MRALPNMTVVAPGDPVETRLALRQAVRRGHGTYLRIGKKGEAVVHATQPEFTIGKAITVRDGVDVCFLSTGTILPEVIDAAKYLEQAGIDAHVASFHTVKPLDEVYLRQVFADFPLVATVEEHGLIGGFGASVAEWLAEQPARTAALIRFGTSDRFHHEAGDQDHARYRFGLTARQIADRVLKQLVGTDENAGCHSR